MGTVITVEILGYTGHVIKEVHRTKRHVILHRDAAVTVAVGQGNESGAPLPEQMSVICMRLLLGLGGCIVGSVRQVGDGNPARSPSVGSLPHAAPVAHGQWGRFDLSWIQGLWYR
jgi:hypothetical protein